MDCLRGLVGLIAATSQDYGGPLASPDDDYKRSRLGLWVWDLVGPVLLNDGRFPGGEEGDLFVPLVSAFESAIDQLPLELATFLGSRLQSSYSSYSGRLGEVATTGIVAVTGSLAGYALPTRVLKGGSLTINRIGLMLNSSVNDLPITVTRYDGPLPVAPVGSLSTFLASPYLTGKTGEVLKVWTLDVSGSDSRTYQVEPLTLPLDGSIYTISYPITGGYYPLNNRLSCNCGGKDKTINGMLSSSLQSLNGDNAHGLLLDVSASCDFSGVVCDLLANNQYTAAIGYLLYYKAGLNVLSDLLGGRLSPATQIQTEELVAKRAAWEAEMSKYLSWMSSEWKAELLPAGNCYVCNQSGTIYRGTLRL